MHEPDRPIKKADGGIAWAESDRLLLKWDYLLYRPGVELAPAETGEYDHRVAIQRERRFVFGNGVLASVLCAQHLAFDPMRKPVARRCCQCLAGYPFRSGNVGRSRLAHSNYHADGERSRQPALRLNGLRIERQGALEQADGLCSVLAGRSLCA